MTTTISMLVIDLAKGSFQVCAVAADVRRIEIEPDDLGDLLLEQRVVRDLEPAQKVRLETVRREIDSLDRFHFRLTGSDAPDARRQDAYRFGHRRAAPLRRIGRGLPHGLGDHPQPRLA